MKKHWTFLLSVVFAVICEAASASSLSTEIESPITEAPIGETVLYSRVGIGFNNKTFLRLFGEYTPAPAKIIYGEDGYAYIYNPFCGFDTDSYLKCEIKGNKLEAKLP